MGKQGGKGGACREGMGQGGGGAPWARMTSLAVLVLGRSHWELGPPKVRDQGQRSCEGVLNSGIQRPTSTAWRATTPTLSRHVLLPTQSLERPGPLLTAECFFPTGLGHQGACGQFGSGGPEEDHAPAEAPVGPTPPAELPCQPQAGPALSALDLPPSGRTLLHGPLGVGNTRVCVPVMSDSSRPVDSIPPGSSVHGDSPGLQEYWSKKKKKPLLPCIKKKKNTGAGCHALLLGICPHPGIEPAPPTLQVNSLPSEPPGKPQESAGWTTKQSSPPPSFPALAFSIRPSPDIKQGTLCVGLLALKTHKKEAPLSPDLEEGWGPGGPGMTGK